MQNSLMQKVLKLASDQFPSIENQGKSWRLLTTWLAIAFIARAVIALGGNFVLHPDEIMQYLEPAHKAVFGYGVTYWEYYYGARSWIVPGFVASILWLHDLVGLDKPIIYVYVVKLVFCVISLLIPWGLYHFTRRLAGENAGRIALIMGCLWPYLVVFAHKPFTEFVATSIFFGALGLASRPFADTKKGAAVLGSLLVLVVAIRMHYLPAAGLLLLARGLKWDFTRMTCCAAACITSLFLVGLLEYITWGVPFHSYYTNIVFNQWFDLSTREAQKWYFYIARLLYVTAGGVCIFFGWVYVKPRKSVLISSIFIIIFLIHSLQIHKELRFLFLLQVLWMIPAASMISMMAYKKSIIRWTAVATSVFLLFVVSGIRSDEWLHSYKSYRLDNSHYLFGQSNLFDIYFDLSNKDDVKAVAFISGIYLDSPGFYYLHKKVPYYDISTFIQVLTAEKSSAATKFDDDEIASFITHAVGLKKDIPQIENFTNEETKGDYQISSFVSDRNIVKLRSFSPIFVREHFYDFYQENIRTIDKPPVFPDVIE